MKRVIALISLISLALSGCSISNSKIDTSNLKYSLELIEPDSMTLNYGNQLSIQNAHGQEIEYPTVEEVQVFGEIQLTGTPVPIYETTEDGSVIYNGTTFDGLITKVASLSKPCSNEALITFIIDSVTSENGTVYIYVDDSSGDGGAEDDTTTPVSESIAGSPSYEAIVEKYGEDVQWLLTLNGDNVSYIYGCSSYMIYWGSNQTQSVDYGGEDYVPSTEAPTEGTTTEDGAALSEEVDTSSEETKTNADEEESSEDVYDNSDENSESSEEESSTTDSSEADSTNNDGDDGLEEDTTNSDGKSE